MMMDVDLYYHDEMMDDNEYLNFEYNHLYVLLHKVDHQLMDQVMYDDDDVIYMDLRMDFDEYDQVDLLSQHEDDI
jgi:hypothetical protein